MKGHVRTLIFCGLVACGGADPLSKVADDTPLPTPEAAPVECTLLGNNCPNGQTYEMCCQSGDCAFWFDDGTGFLTIEHALHYCRVGAVPADAVPTYDDPRDGTEIREGREPPNGSPMNGSMMGGTNGGSMSGGSNAQTGSGSGSGSGGACYGAVTACDARYSPSTCSENPGCYYTYEECYGSAWACQSFYSPSQCGYQLGCRWDYYDERCVGGAASCGSRGSSGSCNAQRGCYWRDAECTGGAWQCSRHTSENSCRAWPECYWR